MSHAEELKTAATETARKACQRSGIKMTLFWSRCNIQAVVLYGSRELSGNSKQKQKLWNKEEFRVKSHSWTKNPTSADQNNKHAMFKKYIRIYLHQNQQEQNHYRKPAKYAI